MTFLDTTLSYDPARRRCDLVFDGRDFALDASHRGAYRFRIGPAAAYRRRLPDELFGGCAPTAFNARRCWPADVLDASGDLTGTRM